MAYGLKVYDASGNIIVDGASRMLRVHSEGNITVGVGATETYSFSALSYPPPYIVQGKDAGVTSGDYETILVKTGSNYTGVGITNYGAELTFRVFVFKDR